MPHDQGGGKSESEYVRRRRAIRALRIPGAGASGRAVLAVLESRHPNIFAAEGVLAAEAWCSRRTFERACALLAAAGVLEVERLGNRGVFGATNVYRLCWPRIFELSRIDDPPPSLGERVASP
jgi:hypothetical protein